MDNKQKQCKKSKKEELLLFIVLFEFEATAGCTVVGRPLLLFQS
jgi:hypothetical protein